MKKIIATENAPAAIGAYSQAVQSGNLIFVSGQLPLDKDSMQIVSGGIKEQTKQALENLKAIVESAGSSMGNVLKTTVLMQDLSQFQEMNSVYETFFESNPPARAAYQVAGLPRQAMVEIEAIVAV